jgi:hypothetical protein
MRRLLIPVVVCLLAMVAAAHAAGPRPADPRSPAVATVLPDHVVYWHVMRHVVVLHQKADAQEKKGRDGAPYRQLFQLNTQLSDSQARRLVEIAEDCVVRVAAVDAKAREIILAFRAVHPPGSFVPGEPLPPPPPELLELQRERDALVLAARDELHADLGDEDFSRFEKHVRSTVVPTLGQDKPRVPKRSADPQRRPVLPSPRRHGEEVKP